LRNAPKNGKNLLVDPPPYYQGITLPPRKGPGDCRHALMRKDSQTNAPLSNDERPNADTQYVVAAYCEKCRYHFKITVTFWPRRAGQVPCSKSDEANPMHHLRLVSSTNAKEYKERNGGSKYDNITEAHRFVCSGANCPVVVDIIISPPRLREKMLALILDTVKVEDRGRREIQKDPSRYEGLDPVRPMQALGYLRQYLFDSKSARDRSELKKIARRNKKYMLAFADECNILFEYLDFTPVQEDSHEPEVSV